MFNNAFKPDTSNNALCRMPHTTVYATRKKDWRFFSGTIVKPKLSAKLLAYLSPLVPIIAILKNNSMSKREFFNPINWLKEK